MAELSDQPNRAGRHLHGSVEVFTLEKEIDFVQSEPEYRDKGHNALTLAKNNSLRNVLICLQKEARLHEHNAPGPFTLLVVRGKVQFTLHSADENKETIELDQGQLLVFGEPQKHEVVALEESAILLTISKL
jgi:quercetin dioxygenase-like cupin family protein